MKVVIARMKHETNTFSPVPTPLARFAGAGTVPPEGAQAYLAYKGTGTAIGAFIELAEEAGAEIVLPVAASAWASGPLEDATFEAIAQRIVAAVADGCDAVLLDHSDNCACGGTMDTMPVLGAILDAGLQDVAAFAICDPGAVQQMMHAGIGAEIQLALGGKRDMPALDLPGQPRSVKGRVRLLCDGRYRNRGPMARGELHHMGPTAVLDTGKVEIVVVSRQVEPHDLAAFQAVGIDPQRKRFLMLKSRVHWRAALRGLAGPVVECAGTGVCTSDYAALRFQRLRRPMYPLDPL